MAQDHADNPQNAADGKTPSARSTMTLSVRLPLAQANTLRDQAKAKGYIKPNGEPNVNQYLVAIIDLIAPLAPQAPVEQANDKPKPTFED